MKSPADTDPVPRIEVVIDLQIDLLAADGFRICSALTTGAADAVVDDVSVVAGIDL